MNIIVIIACPELCSSFRYANQLDYVNGTKVDKVKFYFCGARNKEGVLPFLRKVFNTDIPQEVNDIFARAEKTKPVPMDENFLSFITRNMFQLDLKSFKCMPALMDEDRYLVLPVNDCPSEQDADQGLDDLPF